MAAQDAKFLALKPLAAFREFPGAAASYPPFAKE
jgi:hypothetical protein